MSSAASAPVETAAAADRIAFDDFVKVDIRIGQVIKAEVFPEVLTLGFPDADGEVVLAGVDRDAVIGGRLF